MSMTNKEAINALKLEGGLEISGKPKRMAEFMEALSVAVEALESLDEARRVAREAERRRETFQKIVDEYQEKFIPQYKERAEKAEKRLLEIEGNGCVPGRVKLVTEEYISLASECKILKKKLDNAERIIAELVSTADRNRITTCFGQPIERVMELVKADRDGRCVVLPCKVGDTVYRIGASICKWREIDRCDEYCDGWQYRDCWDGTSAVLEEKFSLYDLERIGKTVFPTREAAEAALKKEETDHGMD